MSLHILDRVPDRSRLESRTTELLQRLIRFNTVNPPGDEQAAQEFLKEQLEVAGFECELLADVPGRPNLVARMRARSDGPRLCLLGHVDTVLADPEEWTVDPWSGELRDGCVWGRGALDMKSQVAAEAAAGAHARRGGLATGGGRAAAGGHLRRGDRRRARRALALRAAPGPRGLRHGGERGRRRGVRVRRPPALRRVRGREGRLPLHRDRTRTRGPRLGAADRRQRACEARPGSGGARRRPPRLRAHARARGAALRDGPRPSDLEGAVRPWRSATRAWPSSSSRCSE